MKEYTKNLLTAAGLSLLFIAAWDYFYAFPQMDKQRQAGIEQQKMAGLPKLGAPEKRQAPPSTTALTPQTKVVAKTRAQALTESPRIAIDTPSVSGTLALKGARLDDLSLKNYRETVDPTSPIIILLSPEGGPQPYYAELGYLSGETEAAPTLPTTETLWTADKDKLTPAQPVTLTYDNGQGLVFHRKISIDDKYLFTVEDSVENKADKPLTVYPFGRVARIGKPPSAGYVALHEGFIGVVGDGGATEIKYDKIEKEPHAAKTMKGTGGWIGFTDKYWGAVIAPDPNSTFEARFSAMGGAVKTYQTDLVSEPLTVEPGKNSAPSTLYVFAGAKVVDTLDAYSKDPGIKRFDLLIDWGWFYFITRPMFRVIDFLFKILGNFGFAILAVTVLVKLAFLPLANKSYKAIAKMKEIQPKIKELKEKYAGDKQKMNMEQMELFKREKVSPLGGCLPMLFQIPVFFSLYKVLVITIEMRHAPFIGWIKDLSAPDPTNLFNLFGLLPIDPTQVPIMGPYLWLGVWPLLMGFSMWLQMKMNPEPTDEFQKIAFSWMPVMFTFTMGSFASGLVIYWTWNNILSIAQQWVIMTRAGVKFELWDNLKNSFRRVL
jgi:YidC/Oxa1 family membrane protein insertase